MLASGFGGLAVCDAIARRLPKEDIVLLADHAYAPYARRKPAVVVDRVTRLAEQLVEERAPKVLVLASPQAGADALPGLVDRLAPLPVVTLDGILPQAAARSRSGRVALLTGDGCLRGAQLARALKRERGGPQVTWAAVTGLREAVEARRHARDLAQQVAGLVAAGVDAIALGCPHASAVAGEVKLAAGRDVAVVDSAALAAERVRRLVMRARATTTRRRPGRRELISSDPAAAQSGLRARA
ncbi:MAG TPA: aspartate/glutamate racemase family protein [Gaiellales bacterium]|nr:aspartate/glutamate racemase family protein [Gaiellales bacterium]